MIPEMDIIDTPQDQLHQAISNLQLLKELLLKQRVFYPAHADHSRALLLLEQIGREMELYAQFSERNGTYLLVTLFLTVH
jgi:glyoxylase-like metal-dependent hydrolase (beta-lactamase superfamily II)